MNPREAPVQPGSSSQQPINTNDQNCRGETPDPPTYSPITPPERPSGQPSQTSPYPDRITTHYKICCLDRQEYDKNSGDVYITYNIRPEVLRETTGWYCFVSFYWYDVQAKFECVYHPAIQLFENFKFVEGTLKGGDIGVQGVQISMWDFADMGPDLNPKHAVKDDNGNRIMLAIMILRSGTAARLYGKMVRDGDDEKEVWFSKDERTRLGMSS